MALALPLAWKWELGLRQTVACLAALGVLWGFLVAAVAMFFELGGALSIAMVSGGVLISAFGVLLFRFFRNPERVSPCSDGAIVSPADGIVIYVRRSERGVLPVASKRLREYPLEEVTRTSLQGGEGIAIGVAMSFLDVHVNRAPMAGRVVLQRDVAGSFRSLKHPEAVFENARMTTVIEDDGVQVAVVQIASRLIRRIVTHVRQGETVTLGQRIGVITFGSQVDLVLPSLPELRLMVRPGQRVTAGESIVAVLDGPAREVSQAASDLAQAPDAQPRRRRC